MRLWRFIGLLLLLLASSSVADDSDKINLFTEIKAAGIHPDDLIRIEANSDQFSIEQHSPFGSCLE